MADIRNIRRGNDTPSKIYRVVNGEPVEINKIYKIIGGVATVVWDCTTANLTIALEFNNDNGMIILGGQWINSTKNNISQISWGDGSISQSSPLAIYHTYAKAGKYTITINGNVTYIENFISINGSAVRKITFPSSISEFANTTNGAVFGTYANLISFENKSKTTILPRRCFYRSPRLETIILPDALLSIGESCFEENFSLKSIVFPTTLQSIGTSAFKSCTSINNVSITCQTIGAYAFKGCSALQNLALNDGVVTIGGQAFSESGVRELTIPDTVQVIDNSTFSSNKLNKLKIGTGITQLKSGTFSGSNDNTVEELIIPDNVTEIGAYCFSEFSKLKNLKLSENITLIDYEAFRTILGNYVESLVIPASVATIGNYCFKGFNRLKSLVFNDGNLITIGLEAFYNTTQDNNLVEEIIFPKSLKIIDQEAFVNFGNLKKVYVYENTLIQSYALGFMEIEDENGNRAKTPLSNFTIYGKKDSSAETYATQNGFTFIPI